MSADIEHPRYNEWLRYKVALGARIVAALSFAEWLDRAPILSPLDAEGGEA